MTTRPAPAPPVTDDYTYEMQVDVPERQLFEALTDDVAIGRWWTAATRSEQDGNHVKLFREGGLFVSFTVEHAPGTGDVVWTVTDCPVMGDWVGTAPSFSVRPNADGTSTIAFRHVGLSPALECFDQCQAGWNHFMPSLYQFLETGVGRPNEPRNA
jgi:hypothetical protein